jgi:molybdopterin-guanine dinucleotide biosynthesis protein A
LTIAASDGPARGACVVACDMPAMGGELLDHLLGARNRGAPAAVLVHPATHQVEPLGAVYEADSLGPIQEALASGQRSAVRLLESIPAYRVQVPPSLADQLANANTPEEWETLRRTHE